MEIKEAISRLQTLLDTEISLATKQAIAVGIESLKNCLMKNELDYRENDNAAAIPTENNNERESILAAFDAGYKACIKEALNWLKRNGDNYVWFFEDDGGLTDDIFDELAHYLNHKLEINDL